MLSQQKIVIVWNNLLYNVQVSLGSENSFIDSILKQNYKVWYCESHDVLVKKVMFL